MEVGQADQVAAQKDFYIKNKWHSFSIARNKVVYARDEDPDDTVIIRCLYPQLKENNKIFGLKAYPHIQTLFLTVMKMFEINMSEISKKTRYVKREEFEELKLCITQLADYKLIELSLSINRMEEEKDYTLIRFPTDNGFVNVKMLLKTDYPQIVFVNETKEGEFVNSINLFIGEAIKLTRYLNSRFNFTENDTF